MGTRTPITWEEFLAAAVDGQECERIAGEVLQMSSVNLPHEGVLALLIEYLTWWTIVVHIVNGFGSPPTGPLPGLRKLALAGRLGGAQRALSGRTSDCEHGWLCARRGVSDSFSQ